MAGVLIVEADPFVRHLLRLSLTAQWHSVFEATDDEKALKLLARARDPLVVILSSRILPVDGFQLLQAVATDQRLRERHGFLVLTREAGWLPESFRRLQDRLHLRHLLRPKNLVDLGQAVRELYLELPYPKTTAPARSTQPHPGIKLR